LENTRYDKIDTFVSNHAVFFFGFVGTFSFMIMQGCIIARRKPKILFRLLFLTNILSEPDDHTTGHLQFHRFSIARQYFLVAGNLVFLVAGFND